MTTRLPQHRQAQRQSSKTVKAERTHGLHGFERRGWQATGSDTSAGASSGGGMNGNYPSQQHVGSSGGYPPGSTQHYGGNLSAAAAPSVPQRQHYHPTSVSSVGTGGNRRGRGMGGGRSSWWSTLVSVGCAGVIFFVWLGSGGSRNANGEVENDIRPSSGQIQSLTLSEQETNTGALTRPGDDGADADAGGAYASSIIVSGTAPASSSLRMSPERLQKLRKAAIPTRESGIAVRIFHAIDAIGGDTGEAATSIRRLAAMLDDQKGNANGDGKMKDDDDNMSANGEGTTQFAFRSYDPLARKSFLSKYGHLCYDGDATVGGENPVLRRYDALVAHPSLQLELWKACMLYLGHGSAYVDTNDVVMIQTFWDAFLNGNPASNFAIKIDPGIAAEGDESSKDMETSKRGGAPPLMVHPSLLIVSEPLSSVPLGVIKLIVETSNEVLESAPLLLPREMKRLIDAVKDGDSGGPSEPWTMLKSRCTKLADPSVTGQSLWSGVKLSANAESGEVEPIQGSIAEQLVPGTDRAITGERYGTSRLYPKRHDGLHGQADSESSLVHTSVTPDANSRRVSRHCVHPSGGMCCEVYYPNTEQNGEDPLPLLLVRHPVSGRAMERNVPSSGKALDADNPSTNTKNDKSYPLPYLTDLGEVATVDNVTYTVSPHEAAYMSTVREVHLQNGFTPIATPNFFDILLENDCLPTSKACHSCLKRVRDGKGHDCKACAKECGCYCKILCKIRPPEKQVVKEYKIYPPAVRKDGDRLVPRIVHQTWFEPVTKEKYPNMSRLIASWERSGWTYNFWSDEKAAAFLSTHFPPEVREAYDSVLPGAFKADLFRYCVLLIQGGVYADMDVLLESNLDAVVSGDVGFMVPMDSPGTKIGRRSCLWNGLMAVAPGHPFLAKTIELVVNNIRNRFTSVDYDDMLCPRPIFQISHSVDTLFTCGPCILGGGINAALGKHMQEPFEPGDIDIWSIERLEQSGGTGDGDVAKLAGMDKKRGIVVRPDDQRLLIPGRTIILQQNKEDMGAHRFTWVEKNLMVAATDMPDYDDRPPTLVHYSKTHGKAGVYGVKKLYVDRVKADEKIRLVVQPI